MRKRERHFKKLTNDESIGSSMVAVAMFDVNSVKNVTNTLMVKTIAKSDIESKTVN